jgi:hypothetical protein
MDTPKQAERTTEKDKGKEFGTIIVIAGALASIALWLIVLTVGNPIHPFTSPASSYAYAILVSAPALALAVLAIYRTRQRKSRPAV